MQTTLKVFTIETLFRKSIYDLDVCINSINRGTGSGNDIQKLYDTYEYCADGLTVIEHGKTDIFNDLLSIRQVINLIVERLKLSKVWIHPYTTLEQKEILYLLSYRYESKLLSCLSNVNVISNYSHMY